MAEYTPEDFGEEDPTNLNVADYLSQGVRLPRIWEGLHIAAPESPEPPLPSEKD